MGSAVFIVVAVFQKGAIEAMVLSILSKQSLGEFCDFAYRPEVQPYIARVKCCEIALALSDWPKRMFCARLRSSRGAVCRLINYGRNCRCTLNLGQWAV
jgi:hypothetical protein